METLRETNPRYGFHGPYGHAVAEEMEKRLDILAQISRQFLPVNG